MRTFGGLRISIVGAGLEMDANKSQAWFSYWFLPLSNTSMSLMNLRNSIDTIFYSWQLLILKPEIRMIEVFDRLKSKIFFYLSTKVVKLERLTRVFKVCWQQWLELGRCKWCLMHLHTILRHRGSGSGFIYVFTINSSSRLSTFRYGYLDIIYDCVSYLIQWLAWVFFI